MIVELANKFRFEIDEVHEIINSSRVASLQLFVSGDVGSLKNSEILKNFTETSLSSIRVFESDKSVVPMTIYTDYTHLAHFERVFSSDNKGHVTIILAMDEKTKETNIVK